MCPITTSALFSIFFSKTIANIWNKFCDRKLVYLILFATWILPILTNLHKHFEPGIVFAAGNGNETGYTCYAKENGTYVILTTWQWYSSIVNNIVIFIIIIASYFITWCGIKKETEETRDKILELKSCISMPTAEFNNLSDNITWNCFKCTSVNNSSLLYQYNLNLFNSFDVLVNIPGDDSVFSLPSPSSFTARLELYRSSPVTGADRLFIIL